MSFFVERFFLLFNISIHYNIILSIRTDVYKCSFFPTILTFLGGGWLGRSTLMKLKAILDSFIGLFRPNNKTSTINIVINNVDVNVYF